MELEDWHVAVVLEESEFGPSIYSWKATNGRGPICKQTLNMSYFPKDRHDEVRFESAYVKTWDKALEWFRQWPMHPRFVGEAAYPTYF